MTLETDPHGILIVDDNPTNLEVLSMSLSHAGFKIAVAIDGESALEQVTYHRPELILLDVMMPGIDGFETCRRLKENPETYDIPVIFMTALSDTENKVQGLSLGAVDYIAKPFQHEEVLARVKIHLQIQNLTRTLKSQNNLLKEEIDCRERAEEKLLTANKELESFNARLEDSVVERTEELSRALQDLQKTQVKLIQQEKLSALGQLVAGVAHEINNPVNFIHGNITHASGYTSDLLKLVQLYQKKYPEPDEEILDEIEKIDIDFLSEDLPRLINSMEVGTDRIRNIVLSLRTFSRLDEAEVKAVNLHEGIDSTLLILNSRLKGQGNHSGITVVKEYGDLPLIKCYPGQLNQVFMNILSNAIDALEEKAEAMASIPTDNPWKPEILIRTEPPQAGMVSIHLIDNGSGIPAELREKIFDPFFTTKPVGKGTGLGMSISYDIITEKHHGTLSCSVGEQAGTCFTITVPIDQAEAEG
jgi:two-component system, NtrC family, sensor kinase